MPLPPGTNPIDNPSDPRARFDELLADRAVQGLAPDEARELQSLADQLGIGVDDSLDRAAAAADLALSTGSTASAMPAELRARLLAMSREMALGHRETAAPALRVTPSQPIQHGPALREPKPAQPVLRYRGRSYGALTAWGGWLAAAACLAFAAIVSIFVRSGTSSG